MGNRAIIVGKGASIGIYLHWNGGRDSVEAFLGWAEMAELPGLDESGRGVAPLVGMLVNYFGNDGTTVSVIPVNPRNLRGENPGDNGIYVVEGHTIVDRVHAPHFEQQWYVTEEMILEIDLAQPERDQIGADYINAETKPATELAPGERVFVRSHGHPKRFTAYPVLGKTNNGVPYLDRYQGGIDNEKNPNAHVRTETVKIMA